MVIYHLPAIYVAAVGSMWDVLRRRGQVDKVSGLMLQVARCLRK